MLCHRDMTSITSASCWYWIVELMASVLLYSGSKWRCHSASNRLTSNLRVTTIPHRLFLDGVFRFGNWCQPLDGTDGDGGQWHGLVVADVHLRSYGTIDVLTDEAEDVNQRRSDARQHAQQPTTATVINSRPIISLLGLNQAS